MARESDPDWKPIKFVYVWTGHLLIGSLTAALVLVAATVMSRISLGNWRLHDLFVANAVAMVVCETILSVVDREYSKIRHHDAPGGLVPTIVPLCVYFPAYFGAALLVTHSMSVAWIALGAGALVQLGSFPFLKPWEGGMTLAEANERAAELEREEVQGQTMLSGDSFLPDLHKPKD
ncbi:hypothetical protein [Neoactinobaculum massilliense]|uniref:hypothetical protein n=1 Tax=Neoactinobaculum massilliense TaxID=2364794 RepID=UPI000F53D414|nr:hypothetical protein [Neoactinobaculum massilliense]